MGFSVAAAAAIIFAGGLVCVSVVMQAVESARDDVSDAEALEAGRLKERTDTVIAFMNGTANGTVTDLNLTNNGSTVIHAQAIDVVINGTVYTMNITNRSVDGITGTNLWAPGQTLRLTVQAPVSGPATVRIITDVGYTFVGKVN